MIISIRTRRIILPLATAYWPWSEGWNEFVLGFVCLHAKHSSILACQQYRTHDMGASSESCMISGVLCQI